MIAENFRRDVRIGLRVLRKESSFCALAVTVLALGICGVTTTFSLVNGVMLRGFSFSNADRLMSANFIDPSSRTSNGVDGQVSAMDYEELLPQQKSFEKLAAYLSGSTVNMTIDGQPRRFTGAYVTEDFLRILGVSPLRGRDLTAADDTPGAPQVALIGYGMWQRDFGGAADILGKAVRLNGKPATIVGVMPKGFAFPTVEELWIPLFSEFPPRPRNDPAGANPSLLGLLKRGVSVDAANAEFTTLARRFAAAYPDSNKAFDTGEVQPLIRTFTSPSLRGTLWTMLAFCVGVLLIACVNVMNMQFARATLRTKELAIRSSLGARRARLVAQMLTESLLVATLGALIGVGLAYLTIDWLSTSVHNLANAPPSWMTFEVDGAVLAFTVGATAVAAVASGLLPAWMSSGGGAVGALRDAGRGNTSRGVTLVSRGLVVFQLGVTCVLLIGSMLQLRSLVAQEHIDYGYDTAGLMSARMGLMEGDYPSQEARKLFFDRLLPTVEADPAIQAAALTTRFRMVFDGNGRVEIEGKEYPRQRDRPQASFEQVTGSYFAVTGQRLLAGRTFESDDLDSRQPVAVVNAAFAEKHWGHDSALGRRFRTTAADGTGAGPWRTVVGVVSNVRMLGPFNNPGLDESGFYVPFYSNPFGPAPAGPFVTQFATVVVRPRPGLAVAGVADLVRRDVAKADPNLPLYYVGTPESQLASFVAGNRIIATMFWIFGLVAVVLASVGIYGVMSFAVNQRTQEFGVRMALGADAGRILRMVLTQGVWQIAIGVTLGGTLALLAAAAIGDAIQNVLFGVSGRDPLTYTSVIALIAVVSLSATFVPARRATRVHPMTALRAH
jgi:putative ABC transport system permease protein